MKKTKATNRIDLNKLSYGLLFGFLVVIGLIFIGDVHKVSKLFITFQWRLFPFVILLTLSNYTLRFFKWHYYLHVVGIQEISILESLRIFIAGFPLAVTPGKVGEAIKGIWLEKATGLPVSKGVSVVLAERISDGFAVLLLSISGVIAYPQYWRAFIIVFSGLIGIIIVSQIRVLALWLIEQTKKIPIINRYTNNIHDFYEGSYLLFNPKTTLIAVGLGTISWLGEGIGLYLILIGLGLEKSLSTLSLAVFILSFSTIIGAVSTLPGGIGAAEASIAGMLTLLLGLTPDESSTATLLIRFATLWFGVSIGLLTWLLSRETLGLKPAKSQQ